MLEKQSHVNIPKSEVVKGIIFRRTIRASYASLDIVVSASTNVDGRNIGREEEHVVVLLQFHNADSSTRTTINVPPISQQLNDIPTKSKNNEKKHPEQESAYTREIRSHIRRTCKLGTLMEFHQIRWVMAKREQNQPYVDDNNISLSSDQPNPQSNTTKRLELVVLKENINNNSDVKTMLDKKFKVIQIHKWTMIQCQSARSKYYPNHSFSREQQGRQKLNHNNEITNTIHSNSINNNSNNNWGMVLPISNSKISLSARKKRGMNGQTGHGGGLGKRQQGEIISDFLIQVILDSTLVSSSNDDNVDIKNSSNTNIISDYCENGNTNINPKDIATKKVMRTQDYLNVISYLNSGSGVVDVAGGSGHVSLALSLRGIKSTVVDPRFNVGKLPARDRKVLKKALHRHEQEKDQPKVQHVNNENDTSFRKEKNHEKVELYPSSPPIEFSSYRAWFVKRPDGVDVDFREGSETAYMHRNGCSSLFPKSNVEGSSVIEQEEHKKTADVPICSMCSPDKLLPTCSAIIALHPDEATGDIVDFAVKHRIPFVCVPCCVFSRLFPNRLKPISSKKISEGVSGSNNISSRLVSTYDDLIEYLVNKDKSINVSKLNFDGANLALWSTFPDDRYAASVINK